MLLEEDNVVLVIEDEEETEQEYNTSRNVLEKALSTQCLDDIASLLPMQGVTFESIDSTIVSLVL